MIPPVDRLVRLDPTRMRALVVLAVAVVAFHSCAVLGGSSSWFLFVLAALAALGVAIRTDGATEIVLLAILAVDWWQTADANTWWSIPAAVCLLVVHAAVTLVASGPDAAAVPRPLVLRWVRRTALVALGSAAGGALLLAARSADVVGSWWWVPVALAALAAAMVVVTEVTTRDRQD